MIMEYNTSVDEPHNPVDMVDELRDVVADIEEFMFDSQSQLNTDMITSPYHKDADTSTNKIELNNSLPSRDYAGTNPSDQMESTGNKPIIFSLDMPSITNYQEKSPNDGPCASSDVILTDSLQPNVEGSVYDLAPSFCNSQSTYGTSNGLIYHMLNTVVCIYQIMINVYIYI